MVRSPLSFSRGRAQPRAVLASLRAIDARPPGDPERGIWQRTIAVQLQSTPHLLDDPLLQPFRQRLSSWVRLLPYVLSDEEEGVISATERPVIEAAIEQLEALDGRADRSLTACDGPLVGLESADPEERAAADRASWSACRLRADSAAGSLADLLGLHVHDDERRGFPHWLSRLELVQGTRAGELEELLTLHDRLTLVAQRWLARRHGRGGTAFHDRRFIAGAPARTLSDDVVAVERTLRSDWPGLASEVSAACTTVRSGVISECRSDVRGRPAITVHHRGGLRSTIVVGHEVSHGVHLLSARRGDAPSAFVGEAVACTGALLVARSLFDDVDVGVSAALLGDHLVEEIVLGLAVAQFESEMRRSVVPIDRDVLDAAWLQSLRSVYEPAIEVPGEAAVGWARLPELGTTPGHSLAYVWSNLLAVMAVEDSRSLESGLLAGAIDASQLASMWVPGRDVVSDGVDAFERLMIGLADALS